jgi:hypothetical protein
VPLSLIRRHVRSRSARRGADAVVHCRGKSARRCAANHLKAHRHVLGQVHGEAGLQAFLLRTRLCLQLRRALSRCQHLYRPANARSVKVDYFIFVVEQSENTPQLHGRRTCFRLHLLSEVPVTSQGISTAFADGDAIVLCGLLCCRCLGHPRARQNGRRVSLTRCCSRCRACVLRSRWRCTDRRDVQRPSTQLQTSQGSTIFLPDIRKINALAYKLKCRTGSSEIRCLPAIST